MAIRAVASLSLTFGLVSIPVKVYIATESSAAIKFKLMTASGSRLRQQYIEDAAPVEDDAESLAAAEQNERPANRAADARAEPDAISRIPSGRPPSGGPTRSDEEAEDDASPHVVERGEMLKGYEFEKGQFVLFSPAELKALKDQSRETIDIVAFIPERSVDPIYFDKAYFLAPDKRGAKSYSLLRQAMMETGRCALAKWAWRSKEYVVQVRPTERGIVLQQLLYADEVRSIAALGIDLVEVGDTELKLATQLIEQSSWPAYDPRAFVDEEKERILAAVEQKIAGERVVSHRLPDRAAGSAQVVDLVAALRASLAKPAGRPRRTLPAEPTPLPSLKDRKPARRLSAGSTAVLPKVRRG